jgi:hypothetical protein
VECFATLVVAVLRVRLAIDNLHLPLGILECHLLILLLLRVDLLFALPLVGRRAFLAQLLLLLTELFHELLDLPALTCAVACGVMHRASSTVVVTIGHLTRALVSSWASAPTYRHNCSCGGTNRRLVIAVGLVLLVLVVVATLNGGLYVRPSVALAHLSAKLKSSVASWMSCMMNFSNIFSSLTPWQNATTTDALERRGRML